jgi:PHD/YefM family antitoxin component YafN of YafNO toxin-antitoxin module
MARIVSSSEVQNSFGAIAQWTEENREGVVVERRGKPTLAIISYEEYQYLQQLREEKRRREIFNEIEELRREVALRNTDLTPEEAYRLAGFSEEAIRNMLESDKRLAGS